MKRGPKNLLEVDPTLQKRLCDVLAKGNTIKTAAAVCGVSDRCIRGSANTLPLLLPSFARGVLRKLHLSL
jgi:hypothetical protein